MKSYFLIIKTLLIGSANTSHIATAPHLAVPLPATTTTILPPLLPTTTTTTLPPPLPATTTTTLASTIQAQIVGQPEVAFLSNVQYLVGKEL